MIKKISNFRNIHLSLQMHGVLIGCAAGLSLYFYILLTLTQAPSGVAVAHKALIAWCVCIGLAGLTRMGLRVLSPALILGLYVHFAYIAIWTGGIHSVAIAWFIFLPSATLLLGQKSTLFWSACSLSLMLGLSFAQNQHWLGTEIPSAQYAYWASGITISMILGVILFVLIYEKLNDAHTENLLQQTKILTQVEQQLLKTQAHKDEFIAVISHELRTPMNAILGFTELLKDVAPPSLWSTIGHIQQSANQLLQVISDILNFSQLQANKLKLVYEEVNPQNIILSAQARLQSEANEKKIPLLVHIAPDLPASVWIDELRIGQALDQLLSNALKFTEQGQIEINLSSQEQTIRIEIKDTGIGIAESQLEGIFLGFQHGSVEVQKRYGGTGLGLSICEKLIQLHHGQIGVASQLAIGSTFWIEIPIDGRQAPPTKASSAQPRSAISSVTSLRQRYNQWVKQKLQQMPQSYEGKSHIFLMFVLILSSGVFMYAYTSPYPQGSTSNYILSALLLTAVFLQMAHLSLLTIVNSLLVYCTLHIFYLTLYSGGVMSVTNFFYALIPLAPLYLFSTPSRLVWTVIPIAAELWIAYLTAHHWIFTPPEKAPLVLSWSLSNSIPLTGMILFLPMLYKRIRKQTRQTLIEQNERQQETRQALMTQQKLKDQFIGTVSHELRTPMNAIIGFNHLLKEELHDQPAAIELQSYVSRAAHHLITVIDDILDYSQLETGQIKFKQEVFDVTKTIRNAFYMFNKSVNESNVKLSFEMNELQPWVTGDSQRLTQILVNLLSNAVKFTAQGEIKLKAQRDKEGIYFEINDTGTGIHPDKLQSIFGEFEQASSGKLHRMKGHGLGLSITKRLIEAQHGWIKVHSQPQKGTCFSFWIPYIASHRPQAADTAQPQALLSQKSIRILIVDDHPLNRLLVRQVIAKTWPHSFLLEASNGIEALQLLREHAFDLILMDMIMPEMDGVTATKTIREEWPASICNIPILGLTANVNDQAREQCLQSGMNDIIYKPFDQETLLSCIERLTNLDPLLLTT